jgi:hypothetical protein
MVGENVTQRQTASSKGEPGARGGSLGSRHFVGVGGVERRRAALLKDRGQRCQAEPAVGGSSPRQKPRSDHPTSPVRVAYPNAFEFYAGPGLTAKLPSGVCNCGRSQASTSTAARVRSMQPGVGRSERRGCVVEPARPPSRRPIVHLGYAHAGRSLLVLCHCCTAGPNTGDGGPGPVGVRRRGTACAAQDCYVGRSRSRASTPRRAAIRSRTTRVRLRSPRSSPPT